MRVASVQCCEYVEASQAVAAAVYFARQALEQKAQLICFPEAFLTGYSRVIQHKDKAKALNIQSPYFNALIQPILELPIAMILGLIEHHEKNYYNTALFIHEGKIVGRYRKRSLLNREKWLTPGDRSPVFQHLDLTFGMMICHDANTEAFYQEMAVQEAQLIFCLANNCLPRAIALKWKDKHHEIRGAFCKKYNLGMMSSDVTGEDEQNLALGPTSFINREGQALLSTERVRSSMF